MRFFIGPLSKNVVDAVINFNSDIGLIPSRRQVDYDGGYVKAFHNLDISAQPSGTSLKYKIETLNQSAAKNTRIYATSLGWS